MKAIEIKHLKVQYDRKFFAVDDFNLSVDAGEFFGLLGPNGAGKTSIISSITGLLPIEFGEIAIFGHQAGIAAAKKLLGVVPQELVHHGFFSVEEVLKFYSGYYGIWNNQKHIDYLLESLQLNAQRKKRVSQLSGGMKRRLLIAKALVHSPKLLLLDEPSAGVDIELRTILWDFMTELNREGTTILLTTHYLEEAERLCSRLAIMDHGKLLALDKTRDLISSQTEKSIRLQLKNPPKSLPLQHPQILESNFESNWLSLRVEGKATLGEIIKFLQIPLDNILDIQISDGALEHAFLKILKGEKAP